MRSGNQEYDEYEEDDFNTPKKDPPPPSNPPNTTNPKDKSNDRANAIRSKHSVTEQRRRSKINERFQILRDLIPHGDQKRDTASFLLEVIDYVRYLQEKVQKYEGSYEGWSTEPTKLMPWRNSHWRVQSFVGLPQAMRNGSGPASAYPGKFDENNVGSTSSVLANAHTTLDVEPSRDLACKSIDPPSEITNKGVHMPASVKSDAHAHQAQSTVSPTTNNVLNQHGDSTIEGGTISISSAYSQGLLNHLTNALHAASVDLSKASISVQIDLGKRANAGLVPATSIAKDLEAPTALAADANAEESDQAHKRQRYEALNAHYQG